MDERAAGGGALRRAVPDLDVWRVEPGANVELEAVPTRSDAGFEDRKAEGKERLKELAKELRDLQRVFYADGRHRLLVVLQGMDTAGKDSTIRDVFGRMNPQGVRVTSFGVPTAEELAHDYLWRVHPHVPRDGMIGIFNRSHYEDVLVVRVEGLVPEERWQRRYRHLREFERLLADEGTTVLKFFLHISKDEQKERLESRLEKPHKAWKFRLGDLDTRARWQEYMAAYAAMLGRTSTEEAPWFVVPGDRKWYRKLVVGEVVLQALRRLDLRYPPNAVDVESVVVS